MLIGDGPWYRGPEDTAVRDIRAQSSLMLAALPIARHFWMYAAMIAAKSSGGHGRGSVPNFAKVAFISGVRRASLMVALSRLTIAAGVAAGASMPKNPVTS